MSLVKNANSGGNPPGDVDYLSDSEKDIVTRKVIFENCDDIENKQRKVLTKIKFPHQTFSFLLI